MNGPPPDLARPRDHESGLTARARPSKIKVTVSRTSGATGAARARIGVLQIAWFNSVSAPVHRMADHTVRGPSVVYERPVGLRALPRRGPNGRRECFVLASFVRMRKVENPQFTGSHAIFIALPAAVIDVAVMARPRKSR
jgi:hypothetical protein